MVWAAGAANGSLQKRLQMAAIVELQQPADPGLRVVLHGGDAGVSHHDLLRVRLTLSLIHI